MTERRINVITVAIEHSKSFKKEFDRVTCPLTTVISVTEELLIAALISPHQTTTHLLTFHVPAKSYIVLEVLFDHFNMGQVPREVRCFCLTQSPFIGPFYI